jgi:hypothetical protein
MLPAILKAISSVSELGNTVMSWVLSEDGYKEWSIERETRKLEKKGYEALKNKDYSELDRIVHDLKQR